MWVVYAVLSAIFASLTAILSKIGLNGINSNLSTAIRTVVVVLMAWIVVFATGQQRHLSEVSGRNLLFLVLSGIATGLSWLFYFKALQMGDVSKVVPIDKFSVVITMVLAFIFLGESPSVKTIIGGAFITMGTFILIL